MPKYYVRDAYESAVIEAEDATDAVLKAVMHYFDGFSINGTFTVSEQGFQPHSDDLIFDSNYILDELAILFEKKRKKGEDFD